MKFSLIYLRWIIVFKMLSTVVPVAYCCSSRFFRHSEQPTDYPVFRSTPSTSARPPRKNSSLEHRNMSEKDSKLIDSILHSKCTEEFDTLYCQHGGRCFNYTVANYSQPSCECKEGFIGERCEVKFVTQSSCASQKSALLAYASVQQLCSCFLHSFCTIVKIVALTTS
ncbi:protein spitz-like isoform X2 [Hermetia illucens]|uniref:protein spitz-like isoform X2 n=1 Tax=Hermetia illucens TaxID=343691 RepID=UPI0018CC5897|nr:protein spitz-like isoform X2 [Hermetia illucens]